MCLPEYPKEFKLEDGRDILVRALREDDLDKLHSFFVALPEEDRIFLRHDVTDRRLIQRWTQNIDLDHTIPLVAQDGGTIVGDATLHLEKEGWMQHVGSVRVATAKTHRKSGLGTLLTRELVQIAQARNLEKLQAYVLDNDERSARWLSSAGFERLAVLKSMAKDLQGRTRDIIVMVNDVSSLTRILEDWYQDAMIPSHRVPGFE